MEKCINSQALNNSLLNENCVETKCEKKVKIPLDLKENDNTNLWHKIKAELSQVQSNKPLHKNPERSYINNDDTLETFRKAIRNDIHRVYRKKKSTSG